MNAKKIMILGAGVYQVPLIKVARKLGYYVIVVSIPGNYPGLVLADKSYYINTTDYETIYQIAMEEKIDAIVTTGTDVALITIGYVCDKMNLIGISFNAAKNATDKYLMKKAFVENGVKTSEFRKVSSAKEAIVACREIGFPAMIKIVDKSGSRGISKVSNENMIEEAMEYAKTFTGKTYFVVEKYVEGYEIGVDAFVQNGEIKMICPHEKVVYHSGRISIPRGHLCPMDMDDELRRKILEETQKAIKALELDNCSVNIDAIITNDNDVSIIEATGRCGATGIPEVIGGYYGLDYYEAILKNALGEEVDFSKGACGHPTASLLLCSDVDGIMEDISYVIDGVLYKNQDFHIPGKVTIRLDDRPGEMIHAFTDGTKRVGQVVFTEKTKQSLFDRIEEFDKNLNIKIKKD